MFSNHTDIMKESISSEKECMLMLKRGQDILEHFDELSDSLLENFADKIREYSHKCRN